MANKKEELVKFPRSSRGGLGFMMTCGARTIKIQADHGMQRVERGILKGTSPKDEVSYQPSENDRIVYIEHIKYQATSEKDPLLNAVLVDSQVAKMADVPLLNLLDCLEISLIEKDAPKPPSARKKQP
jgi:hypothetical protein